MAPWRGDKIPMYSEYKCWNKPISDFEFGWKTRKFFIIHFCWQHYGDVSSQTLMELVSRGSPRFLKRGVIRVVFATWQWKLQSVETGRVPWLRSPRTMLPLTSTWQLATLQKENMPSRQHFSSRNLFSL